jgi:hypothetical protein
MLAKKNNESKLWFNIYNKTFNQISQNYILKSYNNNL